MKLSSRFYWLFLGISLAVAPALGTAQSNPLYVPQGSAKAVLYKPDTGPAPHVGILLIHRTANYLSHIACTQFSRRGYMVLCMNTRFDNNENQVRFETLALDVGAGVRFLRSQPGITKVLLFGHSGGGPTTSFYQAVAENGVAFCQDPRKFTQCGNELAGLVPADGLILADAHPGNPVVVLRGLNPSVENEKNPPAFGFKKSLDPFEPNNGFNPSGASSFSPKFQERYFKAQSERMNDLIEDALRIREKIAEGKYPYPDNDMILIPRGGNPGPGPGGSAYLFLLDPTIDAILSTRAPQKLLRNDGSVITQVVRSVVRPDPSIRDTNLSFEVGTRNFSMKSFLSANAVRSTNSLDGIDHCSSNNSTVCALQSISVPLLISGMGAYIFIRDSELHYEVARSADRDLIFIEGANHGFTPCTACEQTPGQYSNTVKNLFDYAAGWINARF